MTLNTSAELVHAGDEFGSLVAPALKFDTDPILTDPSCRALLRGQRALVTGSARARYIAGPDGVALEGIGEKIASAILLTGAEKLALHSFEPEMASERMQYLSSLRSDAPELRYFPADLNDPTMQNAQSLVNQCWEAFGGLELLVLAAGTYDEPPFEQVTPEQYQRIHTINAQSPLFMAQRYAQLVAQNLESQRYQLSSTRIVFISSINARMSEKQHWVYDSSKAELEAGMRSLAIEFKPLGIKVIGVAPGLHYTPLTNDGLRENPVALAIQEAAILQGIGTAAEVARAVVPIAHGFFDYSSGSIFPVDGGIHSAQIDSAKVGMSAARAVGRDILALARTRRDARIAETSSPTR